MIPIVAKNTEDLNKKLSEADGWFTFGHWYISGNKTIHYTIKGHLKTLCKKDMDQSQYQFGYMKYFLVEEKDNLQNKYCRKCLDYMNYYKKYNKPAWME